MNASLFVLQYATILFLVYSVIIYSFIGYNGATEPLDFLHSAESDKCYV